MPGNYVSNYSSTEQSPCEVGTYQDNAEANSCKVVGPGFYVDHVSAIIPILCPSGTYQPIFGAISDDQCIDTPKNFFSSNGSSYFISCGESGFTSDNKSKSSIDCIYDQDNDGFEDSNDRLVYFFGNNMPIKYMIFISVLNIIFIYKVVIRYDIMNEGI